MSSPKKALKAKKASWTVCITPHSAMDNTIHSIWKSKGQLSHILQTVLPTAP